MSDLAKMRCPECKHYFPLDHFLKGWNRCKTCRKLYNKEYWKSHKDILKVKRQVKKSNPEV